MVSVKTKLELIDTITGLVSAVGDRLRNDGEGDAERDFMAAACPERLQQLVRTLPTPTMHLLAEIAEGPVSVVGLAARSGRLKGTVSKHVQRLVEAGLVVRELVVDLHRRLHEEMDRGAREFLLRYSGAELQVLVKVLGDLAGAHKDGVRLVPPADRS